MRRAHSIWHPFGRGTDGASAVEFALLLPLLFLILCGIIDFGNIFYQMSIVNEAAREAARRAAVASPHTDKATVQTALQSEYGSSITVNNLDYNSPSTGVVTAKVSKSVPLLFPFPDLSSIMPTGIGVPQIPTSVSGTCVMQVEN